MRLTRLDQNRDGQELPVALAKVRFESTGNGPIHDSALRNTGVRFVGVVVAIGAKIVKEMPRQSESAMPGR